MKKFSNSLRILYHKFSRSIETIVVIILYMTTFTLAVLGARFVYTNMAEMVDTRNEEQYINEIEAYTDRLEVVIKKTSCNLKYLGPVLLTIDEDLFYKQTHDLYEIIDPMHKMIMSVTYININGEEELSVAFGMDKEGHYLPVNSNTLHATKPYFTEAVNLNFEEVYLSPITLKMKDGVVMTPNIPIIHFSTPVFENDEVVGVITLTMNVLPPFSGIKANPEFENENIFMINQDGDYISHKDPKALFAFANDNNRNLFTEVPELKDAIFGEENVLQVDDYYYFWNEIPLTDTLNANITETSSDQVKALQKDQDSWFIAYRIPADQLNAEKQGLFVQTVTFTVGFLTLLTIGVSLISSSLRKTHKSRLIIKKLNNVLVVINKVLRHDLSEKFNNIKYDLELLHKDPSQLDKITEGQKAAESGLALVEEMKELEEMIKADETRKEVDLYALMNEITSKYNNSGVKFEIIGQGKAYTDQALRAVTENIITNALKNGKTETIVIQIEEVLGGIQLKIVDDGLGISEENKEILISEDGEMSKTPNRQGLSLFIISQTISRYGGKVWIEDNEPQGTIISIYLPHKSN